MKFLPISQYVALVETTVREVSAKLQCNCGLELEKERLTGHTPVCRIHKAALDAVKEKTE
ncbi:hypothetical protein LCGC14_2683510 [marine sediment metagenome]|uniref:Uncharacterized protein n=1 Tax=marine sediment metagenome TaxID=412755 RepID=A0A0F8ZKN6_9ZZZZ